MRSQSEEWGLLKQNGSHNTRKVQSLQKKMQNVNIKSRHAIWEIGLHEYKSTHVDIRFE